MLPAIAVGGLIALAIALPLAWKWQLGMRRSASTVIALAVVMGLVVAALDTWVGLSAALAVVLVAATTLALSAATVLWRFYRDPERVGPDRPDVVVSPADGVVIYVHRSEGGQLPVSTKHGRRFALEELVRTPLAWSDSVVIGIALSFLDVHVNRAPFAGRVRVHAHAPGPFRSLKDPVAVYTNERVTMVLEGAGIQAAIVLIASRLVRRIVSYVSEGDDVAVAQRIGMIRFGSQVDLVLPEVPGLSVRVRPGERVRAGQTEIAVLEDLTHAETELDEARSPRTRPD